MQAYNPAFARIYNARWASFAQNAAPRLRTFYESTPLGEHNRDLLDLCCGTGQLALHFLDNGYHVTGLDLSDAMLDYARQNVAPYLLTGQARFVQGDAANFKFDQPFGLVLSTFDALNHLPGWDALKGCFLSVFPVLAPGGTFIFDLNTPLGLRRWTGISVEDSPELMLVTRSLFDETTDRAFTRISGFVQAEDDRYERFEETAYEIPFELEGVKQALLDTGFIHVRFAKLQDLSAPLSNPEQENRVFIITEKPA